VAVGRDRACEVTGGGERARRAGPICQRKSGREREGRVRLMGGADRSAGGRGRGASTGVHGGWAAMGHERRGDAGTRGRRRRWAGIGPADEGESFSFFLCFLFSFSINPFLLYPNIYLCFLGAKMKYYM
jgi:hypothetical protein